MYDLNKKLKERREKKDDLNKNMKELNKRNLLIHSEDTDNDNKIFSITPFN